MPGEALSAPRRILRACVRVLRWCWAKLLLFLEVIGLYRNPSADRQALLPRLQRYHQAFRRLLAANERFLDVTSDLEQKLSTRALVDVGLLQRRVVEACTSVYNMTTSLNIIAEERHAMLWPVFERITRELQGLVEGAETVPAGAGLVLDLEVLHAGRVDDAGGKMANLGEVRNRTHLPTPDGFVVTVAGYHLLVEEGVSRDTIHRELTRLFSEEDVALVSQALREKILRAPVPAALASAILEAYDRLAARLGSPPAVAVRSSAVDEDSSRSFAGQFLSLLGVTREGLVQAYLEVVASLYCPEAVHYRMLNGITGETAAMAVGVIAMVDADAGGVAYSRDPNHPESGPVLIQAVPGLGVSLADGRASAEAVRVGRDLAPASLTREPSLRTTRVRFEAGAGLREEPVGPGVQTLSDAEALELARWSLVLEGHYGVPQDIEWAIDRARQLVLLQSRPLAISRVATPEEGAAPCEGYALLVDGGETAFPGVAVGVAVLLDEGGDLEAFPPGAVLVAPRSSPKFVRLMGKASAIVTDAGSTTGHMATLARELRVPALLNTRTATKAIAPGTLVTVDSRHGHVYAGECVELVRTANLEREAQRLPARATPAQTLLEQVAKHIVPLNLTDAQAASFTPEHCRTLHDLVRYIHEKSYEEMFGLGAQLGDARSWSHYLDVFLPIDLYVIDLGGGLDVPAGSRQRTVKIKQVTSVPLGALLKGMLHEKIPRYGPRPIDMKGLFSIMARHAMTSPEQERTFRDPCYAMISDHYLNYTARVGYHFGVVDAYCGRTTIKNYIHMHFRGGAADFVRRCRRARAVAEIMRALGFFALVDKDAVNARLSKATQADTARQLEMIGRLLQFIRQMDVAMVSEETVEQVREAFLRGDYDLSGVRATEAPGQRHASS